MRRSLAGAALLFGAAAAARAADDALTFQTFAPWSPRTHLNADVAIVYGIDDTLPARIASWREHGYRIEVMTGAAWGRYAGFLEGADGAGHGQAMADGRPIVHPGVDLPYLCPSEAYGRYLVGRVRQALDAGAQAIHLEEPEYWARAGYEECFRREWRARFGEKWRAPESSVDAQYSSGELKAALFRRVVQQVMEGIHAWGREHGRDVRGYVPTHSLLAYAYSRIVSPESQLLDAGIDGLVAQVWTGTARLPNVLEGRRQVRTFETAFLEYAALQGLARAAGRPLWYLGDPVEDDPGRSWASYRSEWEATIVAALMQSESERFEIMPWPDRVFSLAHDGVPIPKAYETELQVVIHALREMATPLARIHWESAGTAGIGVLTSDSMMFERGEPYPSDPDLGSFYGLALPLLSRGVPVEPVSLELADRPGVLDRYRVLLLTYEGQKPASPGLHAALARWVRAGGVLVVVDDDCDAYHDAGGWWRLPAYALATPRHHLFDALGLRRDAWGRQRVGRGLVWSTPLSPAALSHQDYGATVVRDLVERACALVGLPYRESSALVLRRGAWVVAAGLSESGGAPLTLRGRYLDLFDAELPLLGNVSIAPGDRRLLLDIDAATSSLPHVVAAAARVSEEEATAARLSFRASGIADTEAIVRIAVSRPPLAIRIGGVPAPSNTWDIAGDSIRIRFPNRVDGVSVELVFDERAD
jgi:hypothetical protein